MDKKPVKKRKGLTATELASLDTLITVAQARGLSLSDRVSKTEEEAQARADLAQAMWDARHGGLEVSAKDLEIYAKIRKLASGLTVSPTLGQLITLRGEALRKQSGR